MMYKNITDNLSITTTSTIRNKCDSYLCWFFYYYFSFIQKELSGSKKLAIFVFILFLFYFKIYILLNITNKLV
jgi:hypothetical protein